MRTRRRVGAVVICFATTASTALAQGNGHGHVNAHVTTQVPGGSGPSAAGAPVLQPTGSGVRNFGSWLDDASVIGDGRGTLSLSFGYWKTPGYHELDVPVIDGGIGLARRVQFGFTVPYYHASAPGGPADRGLGDLYLSSKIQIQEPVEGHQVGFAVSPMLEVLSYAPRPDVSRLGWAIPASLEVQRSGWRAFGSVGYFSRGALFASGALEVALSDRAWVTGSISESRSTERDDLSAALGVSKTRTDVSGGLSASVSPKLAIFGSIGRTISKQDSTSATVFFASGVSFSFEAWRRPPRPTQSTK
jgi:hypothetical protein